MYKDYILNEIDVQTETEGSFMPASCCNLLRSRAPFYRLRIHDTRAEYGNCTAASAEYTPLVILLYVFILSNMNVVPMLRDVTSTRVVLSDVNDYLVYSIGRDFV